MARQKLGPRKVAKLRKITGLDIVGVYVRGNTNHRQDLCLADGTITHRWPDGYMEKDTFGCGHGFAKKTEVKDV